MGTSDKAFHQVKAILGKLDRSIDQAREKRLHGPLLPIAPVPMPAVVAPASAPPAVVPKPAPGAVNGAAFGRAKPLNRDRLRGPENNGPTIWR